MAVHFRWLAKRARRRLYRCSLTLAPVAMRFRLLKGMVIRRLYRCSSTLARMSVPKVVKTGRGGLSERRILKIATRHRGGRSIQATRRLNRAPPLLDCQCRDLCISLSASTSSSADLRSEKPRYVCQSPPHAYRRAGVPNVIMFTSLPGSGTLGERRACSDDRFAVVPGPGPLPIVWLSRQA